MKIILLRHATRKRGDREEEEYLEKRFLLDSTGEEEARKQGQELARRGIKPAVYFTSCFAHAKQTGEILRDTVGGYPLAKVVELCTLTPHYQGPRKWQGNWQGIQILEAIIRESELTGNDLRKLDAVAFILHQPRLTQLLASMTSQGESRFVDLGYSEGVCLNADLLDAFLQGKGKEDGLSLCRQ